MKQPDCNLKKIQAAMLAEGVNLRAWCRERNLNYWIVRDVLRGRLKGRRGQAHKAAVLLGIKQPATTTTFIS
ncbi:MAG: hypothetical protein FD173_947 [Gallionellaceae bacterium]|nr:MAG: hypothetical protein FD173_947 [Gallionellaceae bacterium]